jgi:predicted transposase YbfD/YdcC
VYEEIKDYFDWIDMQKDKAGLCEEWQSGVEKDHGRIEKRKITTAGVTWFADKELWQDLHTMVRYRCTRTIEDKTAGTGWKTSEYDRYYISSLEARAERFGHVVRQHWSIENQLHWSLDVSFGEDKSRIRKNHAPENMNILRKLALNRLRAMKTEKKLSVRRKQLKSLLNQDFLCAVLFGES